MVRKYRKLWLKRHAKYENKARIIFQRSFKKLLLEVLNKNLSINTIDAYLESYITTEKIQEVYKEVYLYVGTIHGKRVGREINKQINQKDFTLNDFLSRFERNILSWLVENAGDRIVSVKRHYLEFIRELIARGVNDNKTISEITTDLQRLIKSRNFYRWQSLRIARTETTASANYAAIVASETSGVVMDKVWISAIDIRTRKKPEDAFDHYEMHKIKVGLKDNFIVSGEKLRFPGDPKGSAGNVINCRCTVAQIARRDENGRIIRTNHLLT